MICQITGHIGTFCICSFGHVFDEYNGTVTSFEYISYLFICILVHKVQKKESVKLCSISIVDKFMC